MLVHRIEVVLVVFNVERPNLENFGNEAHARPALDLDNDVERLGDVRLDGSVRNLDATLQDTSREARDALNRRVGMDSGKCPAVAGV